MAKGQDKRSPLLTQAGELVKQYITYDGNNRMQYVYTANTDADDGDVCTRVEYTYDGSSARIEKMKETLQTWQASYDI